MQLILTNGNIFTGDETLSNSSVIIENGCIIAIIDNSRLENYKTNSSAETIDLKGDLLVPGFIDTQVNGGGGKLFNNDPSIESIASIGKAHRVYGTTGFLPTLITDDKETMQHAILAAQQAQDQELPGFLGIHLEGPYLNAIRKGVHNESKLSVPSESDIQLISEISDIGTSMMTLAPEVVPDNFIKKLVNLGIIVSVGHSNAAFEQIQNALKEGITGFTHLYNAMSPLNSREPGVVGAAINDPESWCALIVDGHHVHPTALQIAIKAKTKGKTILVTDAIHTVGVEGTVFDLAGRAVYRNNGKVSTVEGILAGSDLNMISAVKNTIDLLGIDQEEALRMASLYPANFLKRGHQLGRIAVGYQADFALLNGDLEVVNTWIKGISSDLGEI